MTKRELVRRIWFEFVDMHREGVSSRNAKGIGPDLIPSGGGKSVMISGAIAHDIRVFARLVHENDAALRVTFASKDVCDAARRAFGEELVAIDLEDDPDEACDRLVEGVAASLRSRLIVASPEQTYVFGCWLIRDEFVDDISLGAVRFERKDRWLERMYHEKHVTGVVARRLQRRWAGRKMRPLKDPYEKMKEDYFFETVGPCPTVCSIITEGLARELGRQKALLAARLALVAIALLWERPAAALDGFGLLVDGQPKNQNYLILGSPGSWSSASNTNRWVGSTWITEDDWKRLWADPRWLTGPMGDMFNVLVRPNRYAGKPKVDRSLTHALWWLYEACKAETPLMAAAKFGTCLDVLAGGQSEGKILQLIKARCGSGPDDPVTRDGRTSREVVKMIYGAARSQTMHGMNERYDHDWSDARDLAEHMARRCFVEVLSWLEDHPSATSLAGALVEDNPSHEC